MSAIRENHNYSYDGKKRNTINNRKKKKKKNIVSEPIKNLMMITIVFILGLVIIFNYASITDKKMEISKVNEEIELLNKEKQEIIIILESLKNTNRIEENAKNYLGMNYPTRTQTEFIEVSYCQNKNENKYIAENSNDSYILSLIDIASGLFD